MNVLFNVINKINIKTNGFVNILGIRHKASFMLQEASKVKVITHELKNIPILCVDKNR